MSPRRLPSECLRARTVLLAAVVAAQVLHAGVHFTPDEYRSRRDALRARIDTVGLAVLASAETALRSGDASYPYRQSSDLLYLAGITRPGTFLVVLGSPIDLGGRNVRDLLFIPPYSEMRARITGEAMTLQEATNVSGADTVLENGGLGAFLAKILAGKRVLYHSAFQPPFVVDWLNNRILFIERDAEKMLKEKFPGLAVKPVSPLVASLRVVKSHNEVAAVEEAARVTCDGVAALLRAAHPGVFEYELQAVLESTFRREGAQWTGFPSIIGSGPNSTRVHYDANTRRTQKGDVVVVDVGAEVDGYTADVTRTFPVDGHFTAAQRKLYTIVLEAQKAAIAAVKPGVHIRAVDKAGRDVIDRAGFKKYLTHFLSHSVGLDVHDPGLTGMGAGDSLRAGMVITIEPGIYIPAGADDVDLSYWDTGIRIEDDVLVTPDGCRVLTTGVPKEAEEIESLVGNSD